MACCNCCENTLILGCINSCDAVFNTDITADGFTAGVWILQLTFGNSVIYYSVDVADGETVIFTMNNLNENYTYTGQIIAPGGELIEIKDNGIDYDCIEFSTKVGLSNNILNFKL
jgi:hypothetical protein